MELFRHFYTTSEWQTSSFFQQKLNDFGFSDLDGSLINAEWDDASFAFKYKADASGQMNLIASTSSTWRGVNFNIKLSDNNIYRFYDDGSSSGRYGAPTTIVFIPLINNGFYLNVRTVGGTANFNVEDRTNDNRDKTFNIDTPTPNLNVRVYGTTEITDAGAGVINLIGLPPCSGNPFNWTYILYTRNAYFHDNTESSSYTHSLIDYGQGRVLDLPFRSNYVRMDQHTSHNASTYTNINANTCSLIKTPYDNGYIDNLYLLATAPQELSDATFFSFNGRNFLNVFDNYVVELQPSH